MTNSSIKRWRFWKFVSCSFCMSDLYVGVSRLQNWPTCRNHTLNNDYGAHRRAQPFDIWIHHAKLTETHQHNISWNLMILAEKINSAFSAEPYHRQHVALHWWCAMQTNLSPDIGPSGVEKKLYCSPKLGHFCSPGAILLSGNTILSLDEKRAVDHQCTYVTVFEMHTSLSTKNLT